MKILLFLRFPNSYLDSLNRDTRVAKLVSFFVFFLVVVPLCD